MTTIDRITHTTILCQVLQNYLSDDLANGFFKHSLKSSANNFITQLQNVERKQFDSFHNELEESTNHIYNIMDDFFKTISEVPIYDMENIQSIINAYKKSPQSIEGIVRKINNK